MDPLRRETVDRTVQFVHDHFGRLDGAVVLPEGGAHSPEFALATATDGQVEDYIQHEIVGPVAVASALAKQLSKWTSLEHAPAVTFVTRSGDSKAQRLHQINRAAVEQLIRVWRCEEEHGVRSGARSWACQPNQIVRFDNDQEDNLAFSRRVVGDPDQSGAQDGGEINLWVPKRILRSTGKSGDADVHPASVTRPASRARPRSSPAAAWASVCSSDGFWRLAGVRVLLSAARDPKKLEDGPAVDRRRAGVDRLSAWPGGAGLRVWRMHRCGRRSLRSTTLFEHAVKLVRQRVDMLINNAGISGAEEMVVDMSLVAAWNRTLEANLISNYSLIRKFAPMMKINKSGQDSERIELLRWREVPSRAVSQPGRLFGVEGRAAGAGRDSVPPSGARDSDQRAWRRGRSTVYACEGPNSSPGLFMRRGRLIFGNKRLNQMHAAVLDVGRRRGTRWKTSVALAGNRSRDLRQVGETRRLLSSGLLKPIRGDTDRGFVEVPNEFGAGAQASRSAVRRTVD